MQQVIEEKKKTIAFEPQLLHMKMISRSRYESQPYVENLLAVPAHKICSSSTSKNI